MVESREQEHQHVPKEEGAKALPPGMRTATVVRADGSQYQVFNVAAGPPGLPAGSANSPNTTYRLQTLTGPVLRTLGQHQQVISVPVSSAAVKTSQTGSGTIVRTLTPQMTIAPQTLSKSPERGNKDVATNEIHLYLHYGSICLMVALTILQLYFTSLIAVSLISKNEITFSRINNMFVYSSMLILYGYGLIFPKPKAIVEKSIEEFQKQYGMARTPCLHDVKSYIKVTTFIASSVVMFISEDIENINRKTGCDDFLIVVVSFQYFYHLLHLLMRPYNPLPTFMIFGPTVLTTFQCLYSIFQLKSSEWLRAGQDMYLGLAYSAMLLSIICLYEDFFINKRQIKNFKGSEECKNLDQQLYPQKLNKDGKETESDAIPSIMVLSLLTTMCFLGKCYWLYASLWVIMVIALWWYFAEARKYNVVGLYSYLQVILCSWLHFAVQPQVMNKPVVVTNDILYYVISILFVHGIYRDYNQRKWEFSEYWSWKQYVSDTAGVSNSGKTSSSAKITDGDLSSTSCLISSLAADKEVKCDVQQREVDSKVEIDPCFEKPDKYHQNHRLITPKSGNQKISDV